MTGERQLDEQIGRSTVAQSAQIHANIRLGKRENHRQIVVGSLLLTGIFLGLAAFIGWSNQPAALAFEEDETMLNTATGARSEEPSSDLEDRGDVPASGRDADAASPDSADDDPLGADPSLGPGHELERPQVPELVSIEILACGATIQLGGIAVGTNTVLVGAQPTAQFVKANVTDANGLRQIGSIIGVEPTRDFAVIRLDTGVVDYLSWASGLGLQNGDAVQIVTPSFDLHTVKIIDSTVLSVRSNPDGLADRITFVLPPGVTVPLGSAVLDETGALVAVTDGTPQGARSSDILQSSISSVIVNPAPATDGC